MLLMGNQRNKLDGVRQIVINIFQNIEKFKNFLVENLLVVNIGEEELNGNTVILYLPGDSLT